MCRLATGWSVTACIADRMSKESRPKSASSSARNSSVSNTELLAQVLVRVIVACSVSAVGQLDGGGAKKLQGSMKRKKVKPLPSMPTHAVSSIHLIFDALPLLQTVDNCWCWCGEVAVY